MPIHSKNNGRESRSLLTRMEHPRNAYSRIAGLEKKRDRWKEPVPQVSGLNASWDGLTEVPDIGARPPWRVPFACSLVAWSLSADVAGSAVINVKRALAATPGTFTSICGGSANKPTLTSQAYAESLNLPGWETHLEAGDWLLFDLESVSTMHRITLALDLRRDV